MKKRKLVTNILLIVLVVVLYICIQTVVKEPYRSAIWSMFIIYPALYYDVIKRWNTCRNRAVESLVKIVLFAVVFIGGIFVLTKLENFFVSPYKVIFACLVVLVIYLLLLRVISLSFKFWRNRVLVKKYEERKLQSELLSVLKQIENSKSK